MLHFYDVKKVHENNTCIEDCPWCEIDLLRKQVARYEKELDRVIQQRNAAQDAESRLRFPDTTGK